MQFPYVKKWYASLGIWGGLGTIVGGVAAAVHVAMSPALVNSLNAWSASLYVVITGVMSTYGRYRATHTIAPIAPNPPSSGAFKVLLLALASAAIAGVLIFANFGCSQTQPGSIAATQPTQVQVTYTSAQAFDLFVQQATYIETAGQMPASVKTVLSPLIHSAQAALIRQTTALNNGDSNAALNALNDFNAAMAKATPLLLQLKPTTPVPGTK